MGDELALLARLQAPGRIDLGGAADPRARKGSPGTTGGSGHVAGRHRGPAPDPAELDDQPGRRSVDGVDEQSQPAPPPEDAIEPEDDEQPEGDQRSEG